VTGGVRVDGEDAIVPIPASEPTSAVAVTVPGSLLKSGELNQLVISSGALLCPARLSAGGGDQRELGFGLVDLEFS
jgi:hypothetical protein